MDCLVLALLLHDILENLEVLGDGGLMAFDAFLQTNDGTDRLASLIDHLKRCGDIAHLHVLYHTSHLLWQILHLEA